MPIKHQTTSYRNRNGIKFICDGDVPDRSDATARVKELRAEGFKAFYEKADGYCRVFVEAVKYQTVAA